MIKMEHTIKFNFDKEKLVFKANQSLFSAANVDRGTLKLLNSLRKNNKISYDKILDLGCGYGVMGIFLSKKYNVEVDCVDRDSIALGYAVDNAKANESIINAFASLDYSNVKEKYNLIVCNYPAKARAIDRFVYEASSHLKKDGILAIVVVSELEKDVENLLTEDIEVIQKEKTKGHNIYHLKFKKILKSISTYERGNVKFNVGQKNYDVKTFYDLPEFDTLSFDTRAMMTQAKKLDFNDVTIIEPYQGHIAIAVNHYLSPKKLKVVSRDYLSLHACKKNLEVVEVEHKIFPKDTKGDLLIWRLPENMTKEKLQSSLLSSSYKKIILSCKKSKLKRLGLSSKEIVQKENYCAIII